MKNAGPFGPGVVASARSRQSPSRGEQLPANQCATWEELHTGRLQRIATMRSRAGPDNPEARMPAMRSAWPIDSAAMSSPAHAGDPVASEHRVLSWCFLEAPADTGWPASAGEDKRSVSEIPALRLGNQEIAEHLNARHRFELFRIDEIRLEGDAVDFAEQLDQAAVLLHQIIRQHRDPETAPAGAEQAQHVVDHEPRRARLLAVPPHLGQPMHVL